jgi:hypothetical protein
MPQIIFSQKPFSFTVIVFMILSSLQSVACGGDYVARSMPDEYDVDSGLYFTTITDAPSRSGFLSSSSESRVTTNVFVYDPVQKSGKNVFPKPVGAVTLVLVESEYDANARKMRFLAGEDRARNNQQIEPRKPNPTFLIETYYPKMRQYTVWKADKLAAEPKPLFNYGDPHQWHVDVRNRTIRLLQQTTDSYKVVEFPW